jgi:hypothetical protein
MVRKLVERADVLVERSHSFAPLIKDRCNRLDSGFNDFFQKIMRINHKEVCYIIWVKKDFFIFNVLIKGNW